MIATFAAEDLEAPEDPKTPTLVIDTGGDDWDQPTARQDLNLCPTFLTSV